jgi:hypothetical protein
MMGAHESEGKVSPSRDDFGLPAGHKHFMTFWHGDPIWLLQFMGLIYL